MHSLTIAMVLAVASLLFGCATSPVAPIQTSRNDEFAGTTACHALTRDFLGIPSNAACECIQWQLKLHSSDFTGLGTYTLIATYGILETNRHALYQNGTRTETGGKWFTATNNSDTIMYQLQATSPNRSLAFVKIDENILQLLTPDRELMVGNDSWSCTLNRIPKQP